MGSNKVVAFRSVKRYPVRIVVVKSKDNSCSAHAVVFVIELLFIHLYLCCFGGAVRLHPLKVTSSSHLPEGSRLPPHSFQAYSSVLRAFPRGMGMGALHLWGAALRRPVG